MKNEISKEPIYNISYRFREKFESSSPQTYMQGGKICYFNEKGIHVEVKENWTNKNGAMFCHLFLGGGWTNPFEKYARQNGNLPQIGVEHKKYLKPPPSFPLWQAFVFRSCIHQFVFFLGTVVICFPHKKIAKPPSACCWCRKLEKHFFRDVQKNMFTDSHQPKRPITLMMLSTHGSTGSTFVSLVRSVFDKKEYESKETLLFSMPNFLENTPPKKISVYV